MVIEKPIFIVGAGRSGTTVLYNILSTHPEVCWFSNYTEKAPAAKLLPLLHRTLDWPLIGMAIKKNIIASSGTRLFIRPREATKIYHEYCQFKHDVKTTETDLDPHEEEKFKEVIRRHLALTGKKRFLSKQTANNQRIRLINAMFKDAYFVHIIRDGRAVANSLRKEPWWPDTKIWWLNTTPQEWEKQGKEPLELSALQWKKNVEAILENISLFKDRYIELRYEELAKDVKETIHKITDFCGLSSSSAFYKDIPETLPNRNYKWKKDLSQVEQKIVTETIGPFLTHLGYESDSP